MNIVEELSSSIPKNFQASYKIIYRRKWLILCTTLIVFITVRFCLSNYPYYYKVVCTLPLTKINPTIPQDSSQTNKGVSASYILQQAYLLTSQRLLRPTIEHLSMQITYLEHNNLFTIKELYWKNSPFTVKILKKKSLNTNDFDIIRISDNAYNFKFKSVNYIHQFGDSINMPEFLLVITKNNEFKGTTKKLHIKIVDINTTINYLKAAIETNLTVNDSNSLDLTLLTQNPQQIRDFFDELTKVYLEDQVNVYQNYAALQSIDVQLDSISNKLNDAVLGKNAGSKKTEERLSQIKLYNFLIKKRELLKQNLHSSDMPVGQKILIIRQPKYTLMIFLFSVVMGVTIPLGAVYIRQEMVRKFK